MHAVSIEIAGAFNARAFGGTATWLVRSSNLDAVDADGARTLRDLGVTSIVDLRSEGERQDAPVDARIVSVPLYDGIAPAHGSIDDVYAGLVERRGAQIAAAVAAIADADGAALVHCAVGKDRTGLVVALALLAAGADRAAVVADYALSGAHVAAAHGEHVRAMLRTLDLDDAEAAASERLHLQSPASALEGALDRIDARGGAVAYLLANGLPQAALDRLRAKATA